MRLVVSLLAAVGVFSCGPSWQAPEISLEGMRERVRDRVEQAQQKANSGGAAEAAQLGDLYYALGYTDEASNCYQQASRGDVADWELLAGLSALDGGRDATDLLKRVLELDPDNKTAKLALARAALERGEITRAQASFREVLETHPADPQARLGLARAHLAADQAVEAVTWFRSVLEVRPNADAVHAGLADAYRRAGRIELAKAHSRLAGSVQVMDDDPELARIGRLRIELIGGTVVELATREDTNAEAISGFAVAQLGAVPTAAERLASRAAEVGENKSAQARFWVAVGALADRQGQWDRAISSYQRANGLHGLSAQEQEDARLRLARSLGRAGRWSEAEQILQLLDVSREDAAQLLVEALRRQQRWGEAIEMQQTLANLSGAGRDRAHFELGELYEAAGRVGEASAIFLTLADSQDNEVAAMAQMKFGDAAARAGDDHRASQAYLVATEKEPDWLTPRYSLAATLGRLQRYGETKDQYLEIVERYPREEQAWIGAATAAVLSRTGAKQVRSLLENGLAVLPDSLQLRAVLARHLVVALAQDATAGRRALTLAEEVVQERGSPQDRETLAMAAAATGQFPRAIEIQSQLVEAASASERSRLLENLQRYQANRPCCR